MEDFSRWPPGPLLQLFDQDSPVIFSAPCTCTWPGSLLLSTAELEESVETVSVTAEGIIFFHKDTKSPIFIKKFAFMLANGIAYRGRATKHTIVTLRRRPNVHDDLEIDVEFIDHEVCSEFFQIVSKLAAETADQLQTKIYVLRDSSSPTPSSSSSSSSSSSYTTCQDSDNLSNLTDTSDDDDDPSDSEVIATANLLTGFSALKNIINDVLTALAYTESAEVLGPILDWDTTQRSAKERAAIIARVQQRFCTKTPPPVLILTGRSSDSYLPLPDHIHWRDTEEIKFIPSVRLPSPPSWTGPSPPPAAWVNLPVTNYGIHHRNLDSTMPRYIALSYELVDNFAAAVVSCGQPDMTQEETTAARWSLEAATASVKMTVVHELAHLWVSEEGKSSPLRDSIKGADRPLFDLAQDVENPGQIEAGLLVETCWLGSPHELVMTNEGWLTLAIRRDSAPAPAPHNFALPSASEDDSHTDEDSQAAVSGSSPIRLGSPIHLMDRDEPGSPTFVRVCDPALVAQFASAKLPVGELHVGSVLRPVTPLRRNRRSMASPVATPSPSSTTTPPPHTTMSKEPAQQGFFLGSDLRSVPAVRSPAGVKWPAVFMRR